MVSIELPTFLGNSYSTLIETLVDPFKDPLQGTQEPF